MEIEITWLQVVWFILLGVLLVGYAILDGFDLGVGILHMGAKTDHDRRIFMNSIGPLWDGNEVWLVTFGGALFAAFPNAYATAFSGFYIAFMALLFFLIFRAVSLEFRSKKPTPGWRKTWDFMFFLSSLLATFLFGVAVGNLFEGIPIAKLEETGQVEYVGTFWDLLGIHSDGFSAFPLLIGLLAVATFTMHGAIYLYLKTEGELQQRIRGWIWRAFGAFLILYFISTIYALIAVPNATANFKEHPWLLVVALLNVLAVANIVRAVVLRKEFQAFLSSCAVIAAFIFLIGVALFPNLLYSTIDPIYTLTIAEATSDNIAGAASSEKTLRIMLIVAIIGMPFVIAYTAIIYWVFRGKTKLGQFSY